MFTFIKLNFYSLLAGCLFYSLLAKKIAIHILYLEVYSYVVALWKHLRGIELYKINVSWGTNPFIKNMEDFQKWTTAC